MPSSAGDYGSGSPLIPAPFLLGPSCQVHMAHHVFENIIDSMSVQTFTPEQIAAMISGTEPVQVGGLLRACLEHTGQTRA